MIQYIKKHNLKFMGLFLSALFLAACSGDHHNINANSSETIPKLEKLQSKIQLDKAHEYLYINILDKPYYSKDQNENDFVNLNLKLSALQKEKEISGVNYYL